MRSILLPFELKQQVSRELAVAKKLGHTPQGVNPIHLIVKLR
jgi:hypothetical protein